MSKDEFFDLKDMKFDVVIGNPPYQNSTTEDKSSNLWTLFWAKCLDLAKDDGVVSLITPTTWLSPSRDFKSAKYGHSKSAKYGHSGDVRLWDSFNRYTSVADIDTISDHFKGVGSTFGRVTVYKNGRDGLSFTGGYPTEYGFLPNSDIEGSLSRISLTNNLASKYRLTQEAKSNDIRVSVPMTRLFNNDPNMVEILQPGQSGSSASDDPRSYCYVHVTSQEEAEQVKELIISCSDILCESCRWVGFINLKVVGLLAV